MTTAESPVAVAVCVGIDRHVDDSSSEGSNSDGEPTNGKQLVFTKKKEL